MAEDRGREEVLGQYLAAWVDALREGKTPELTEEAIQELNESQLNDLMATARFIKAVSFSTEQWEGQSAVIRAKLENEIFDMRRRQLADGLSAVISSETFGDCIHSARNKLGTSVDDLSEATGIRKSLLSDVEACNMSPIRIPVERMTELLLRLHMAFNQTVELVRTSAERWALETFPDEQTQLGRFGSDLSPTQRREVIEATSSKELDSEIGRELQRVNEYADDLRQHIELISPKA